MPEVQKQPRLTLPALIDSHGEQVLELLRADETCGHAFSPEIAAKIHLDQDYFESRDDYMAEVVTPVMEAFLEKACSTARKRPPIAQWIIRQYLTHSHNENPILAEDLYKIDDNIRYFNSLRNSSVFKETGASPDLLSYKTYAAFEAMLAPHLQRKEETEAARKTFNVAASVKSSILAETTVLYDGPEGRVVVPHTSKASKYWGNNTK